MFIKVLTVSEVNGYIKRIIDNDFILKNTNIKGEISNLKIHSSGHMYFTLKDDNGKINVVMFSNKVETLNFIPENGMNIIIKGKISVYIKDGNYVLYADELKLDGLGELHLSFEKLKEKLRVEGLFEASRKKEMPKNPKKIGVITATTGSVIRDIINVSTRRNKGVDILIYPSLVQGIKASENLISGIKYFNTRKDVDVIILARGGGSIEELWAFNDEKLAYEIFKSKKPIVSAVGHETDFTISDFVSDLRAPTPSAAAELVVSNLSEVKKNLTSKIISLNNSYGKFISNKFKINSLLLGKLQNNNPKHRIKNNLTNLNIILNRMKFSFSERLLKEKQYVSYLSKIMESVNPMNILNKGYAMVLDDAGNIVSSKMQADKIDQGIIKFFDGDSYFYIKKKASERK